MGVPRAAEQAAARNVNSKGKKIKETVRCMISFWFTCRANATARDAQQQSEWKRSVSIAVIKVTERIKPCHGPGLCCVALWTSNMQRNAVITGPSGAGCWGEGGCCTVRVACNVAGRGGTADGAWRGLPHCTQLSRSGRGQWGCQTFGWKWRQSSTVILQTKGLLPDPAATEKNS